MTRVVASARPCLTRATSVPRLMVCRWHMEIIMTSFSARRHDVALPFTEIDQEAPLVRASC